jgi:hypothetical protein
MGIYGTGAQYASQIAAVPFRDDNLHSRQYSCTTPYLAGRRCRFWAGLGNQQAFQVGDGLEDAKFSEKEHFGTLTNCTSISDS